MRPRRVLESEVLTALEQPQMDAADRYRRRNAWSQVGHYWLRVTYVKDRAGVTVASVVLRKRGPKGA